MCLKTARFIANRGIGRYWNHRAPAGHHHSSGPVLPRGGTSNAMSEQSTSDTSGMPSFRSHKRVCKLGTSLHEPDAQEWILGLGGRFIATFEYSDELSVKGGKKANGLRIGVKHGNGGVSRLQIEMTPVDSVAASSFRFREGALGEPLVDAAILFDEGRYRIGDVETIDGKKLPVFVQLKDVTSAAGPNASLSK